jgi:hypothetical protein
MHSYDDDDRKVPCLQLQVPSGRLIVSSMSMQEVQLVAVPSQVLHGAWHTKQEGDGSEE